jgi:hypothetical protein
MFPLSNRGAHMRWRSVTTLAARAMLRERVSPRGFARVFGGRPSHYKGHPNHSEPNCIQRVTTKGSPILRYGRPYRRPGELGVNPAARGWCG